MIDDLTSIQARTRFSQARAELGMTDRTGGPSSSSYIHRRRPENFEEEYEAGSEGEDIGPLLARRGRLDDPHTDTEDERLHAQDVSLARSLRMRSEGLERTVISMLDQPPPLHPRVGGDDEEDNDDSNGPSSSPPTSPRLSPQRQQHPHKLPDGVRLRLALATVINDLFARSAPPPPFRFSQMPYECTPQDMQPGLPPALVPISFISAYAPASAHLLKPAPRVLGLYTHGADPETANSPPAFRCPRHLHTGCEICVEVRSAGRPGVGVGGVRGRSNSRGGGASSNGNSNNNGFGGSPSSPLWQRGPAALDGGGVTGWQDGSGIGSGLCATGLDGNVLRRKNRHSVDTRSTKLTELIPRFLRLSALVADELGREARDRDEAESQAQQQPPQPRAASSSSGGGGGTGGGPPESTTSSSSQDSVGYSHILRPSREWYTLLAGLLMRAVLEGYLTAGWRGFDAVECILTCGLGLGSDSPDSQLPPSIPEPAAKVQQQQHDEFAEFDPDELPSLSEAVKMLFPGLRNQRRDAAEEEYAREMHERMRRVSVCFHFHNSSQLVFVSSVTMSRYLHPILRHIWKTLLGRILRNPWSEPHCAFARPSHAGGGNPSLKP